MGGGEEKKVGGSFYPLMDPQRFNNLAREQGFPCQYVDQPVAGIPGRVDNFELRPADGSDPSLCNNLTNNGRVTFAFADKATEVARPGFKAGPVYHVLPDRVTNGETWNDHREDACNIDLPGGEGEREVCRKIARASVDCGNEETNPGLYKCGDLHGLQRQFERLGKIGISGMWLTDWRPQAQSIAWQPNGEMTTNYHGYSPRNMSLDKLDEHLQDPKTPDVEFLRQFVAAANAIGIEVVPDMSFGFMYEDTVSYAVGAGNVYYGDEPRPIANWYQERIGNQLLSPEIWSQSKWREWRTAYECRSMTADQTILSANGIGPFSRDCAPRSSSAFEPPVLPVLDWREPRLENFFVHTKGCPNVRIIWPMDAEARSRMSQCSMYGLMRPNVSEGSVACAAMVRTIEEAHALKGLWWGRRIDAIHNFDDETCLKRLVELMRDANTRPATVVGEYIDALNRFDESRNALTYVLDKNPARRMQVFNFGARDALRNAFVDDDGPLEPLADIIRLYEEYDYSPEVMANTPIFIDNHDQTLMADYVPEHSEIIRATNDDIVTAHLSAAILAAPLYVYYATMELQGAIAAKPSMVRGGDKWARPVVHPGTDPDPQTFNQMERAMRLYTNFRREHFKPIGFGSFEPGLADSFFSSELSRFVGDEHFAVKRRFGDEEVLEVVVRGDGKKRPEERLVGHKFNVSDGLWRDALTGTIFTNSNGVFQPIAGSYRDEIHDRPINVDANGRFAYPRQEWLNRATGVTYKIDGDFAELPDGEYRAVRPEVTQLCNPRRVYDNPGDPHDPYDGCPWVSVSGGIPKTDVTASDGVSPVVALRKQKDGSHTLPDGQYVFRPNPRGKRETVDVKDGRIKVMRNTRIFLFAKLPPEKEMTSMPEPVTRELSSEAPAQNEPLDPAQLMCDESSPNQCR